MKNHPILSILVLITTISCELEFGEEFCAANPTSFHCTATDVVVTDTHDGNGNLEIPQTEIDDPTDGVTDVTVDSEEEDGDEGTGSEEVIAKDTADIDDTLIDDGDGEEIDETEEDTETSPIDTDDTEEIDTLEDVPDTDDGDVQPPKECESFTECEGEILPPCKLHACVDNFCVVISDDNGALCNDGDACTENETCTSGQCKNGDSVCECKITADCASKEDGNLCNGTLICVDNFCKTNLATIKNCTNPNECIITGCDSATGNCTTINKNCDDNIPCTNDSCENGNCKNIVDLAACNDDNACTSEACEATGCVYTFLTQPCDDGNPCTIGDTCNDGECVVTPKVCNDDNPCTDDFCVEGECEFAPNEDTCDDGSECSLDDACVNGNCSGTIEGTCYCTKDSDCSPLDLDFNVCNGTYVCINNVCISHNVPIVCTPTNNPCTENNCNPITGTCKVESINEQKPCDVGNFCKTDMVCSNGSCDGKSVSCDDNNDCTKDNCFEESGCDHEKLSVVACSDGNSCTGSDFCTNGICKGSPFECTDGVECTVDECENGACVFTPLNGNCKETTPCGTFVCDPVQNCIIESDETACDDNNPCTADGCDKDGCINFVMDLPCDDGNSCTSNDECIDGTCTGIAKDCDDNLPCSLDECANGICHNTLFDTECNDDNNCTVDTCTVNGCTNISSNSVCDDNNPCTTDVCGTNGCAYTNLSMVACNDNNQCTTNDICALGTCKGVTICECATTADCASKEDGNICNGTLACDTSTFPYTCKLDSATVKTCDPSLDTECLAKQCNAQSGNCEFTAINEALPCNDGDACTEEDFCQNGTCSPFVPLNCNDNNPCSLDACDNEEGCTHSALPLSPCEDGDSATVYDTCVEYECIGVAPFYEDGNGDTSDWTFTTTNASLGSWTFMDDAFNPKAPDPTKVLRFLSSGSGTILLPQQATAIATSPIFEIPKTANPTLTLWRIGNTNCDYANLEIFINETKVGESCGDTINWAEYTYPLPKNTATATLKIRYTFKTGVAIPLDGLYYRFDVFKTNP